MTKLSIPPDQWRIELDSFSKQHEGWIVSVTSRDADGTVGVHARDVPLEGVSQASPGGNAIVVDVGSRDGHLSHEVRDVAAVTIDLTDDRAQRALVLQSRDGTTTTVAFRSPLRSEEVDGYPVQRR